MIDMHMLIMNETIDIARNIMANMDDGDPAKINVVEIYPRDETFADQITSLFMANNDPQDLEDWWDEEIQRWPPKEGAFSQGYGDNFNELGGGQGWYYRFTLFMRMFYADLGGVSRQEAIAAPNQVVSQVRQAIQNTNRYNNLKDDFGTRIVRYDKAVKKTRIISSGSVDGDLAEINAQAKMWLQFEVYHDYNRRPGGGGSFSEF